MPSPQGLKVVLDVHGKPRHSVRGIIVHRKHLYVADEAGDAVKVFEVASGRLVARIKGSKLAKPVHLVLHGDTLYIGAAGTGSILAYDIPRRLRAASSRRARSSTASSRPRPASRSARTAISTSPSGWSSACGAFPLKGKKKGTFIDGLPDMPEFLVHVPDRA